VGGSLLLEKVHLCRKLRPAARACSRLIAQMRRIVLTQA